MGSLSNFFGSTGGGSKALSNTYASFALMETTPGYDSTTGIYTDENGDKWLKTGKTIDATSANRAAHPQAGSSITTHHSAGANAVVGTTSASSPALTYYGSRNSFSFFVTAQRNYNLRYGRYIYGTGAKVVQHPPSNNQNVGTPGAHGYNENAASGYEIISLVDSGTDKLINAYSDQGNDTTANTIATITDGNNDTHSRVAMAHFNTQDSDSDIYVSRVNNNNLQLDVYLWGGSSYSLSGSHTLATSSNDVTLPYADDNANDLHIIEYNSASGEFAVGYSDKVIYYEDKDTPTMVFDGVSLGERSRIPEYSSSEIVSTSGTTVRANKYIIGEVNTITQSVLSGTADEIIVFKKL